MFLTLHFRHKRGKEVLRGQICLEIEVNLVYVGTYMHARMCACHTLPTCKYAFSIVFVILNSLYVQCKVKLNKK